MGRRGPKPFISETDQKFIIDWMQSQETFTVRHLILLCNDLGIKWNHAWLNRLSKEAGYKYFEGWVRPNGFNSQG